MCGVPCLNILSQMANWQVATIQQQTHSHARLLIQRPWGLQGCICNPTRYYVTLKSKLMSVIFEFFWDLPKIHPYTKFGDPRSICSPDILFRWTLTDRTYGRMDGRTNGVHFHSSRNALVVGGKSSEYLFTHVGIPQCSIFIPLFFFVFTNGMSSELSVECHSNFFSNRVKLLFFHYYLAVVSFCALNFFWQSGSLEAYERDKDVFFFSVPKCNIWHIFFKGFLCTKIFIWPKCS